MKTRVTTDPRDRGSITSQGIFVATEIQNADGTRSMVMQVYGAGVTRELLENIRKAMLEMMRADKSFVVD